MMSSIKNALRRFGGRDEKHKEYDRDMSDPNREAIALDARLKAIEIELDVQARRRLK